MGNPSPTPAPSDAAQGVVDLAARCNLGLRLIREGRLDDAERVLEQVLATDAKLAPAWINLSELKRLQGDAVAAAQCAGQALRLAPEDPGVCHAVAVALLDGGRPLDATSMFRRSIAQGGEGWLGLGQALLAGGDASAACVALQRALELDPGNRTLASNLLLAMQYRSDLGAAALREAALRLGSLWPGVVPRPPWKPRTDGRLRVGYVGADFRAHPVGWMLLPVLRGHDRHRIEVHLFDNQPRVDPSDGRAAELRQVVDAVHVIAALDDTQAAALVREQGIDVLVDLAGHTAGGRLGVFALRPAPLQLSWLGYFASTGLSAIDGVVTGPGDGRDDPGQSYVEPLCRLGRLPLAYEPRPDLPPPAACPSRTRGHLSFGSFNNPAKLGDEVVALWSRLLRAQPTARLVLKWNCWSEPACAQRTRARFAAQGVDGERIELRGASRHFDMLNEYADLDVALDPFPFSGGITTLEALAMGVPVVTLPWVRPVSRQTAAVLEVLGLHDLIATTPSRYLDIALALGADLPRRERLRDELPRLLAASPLSDGVGLTRELETLYERMLVDASAPAPAHRGAP